MSAKWRRGPESNRRSRGLQPTAFPLGYRAEEHGRPDAIRTRILELRTLALIHLSYGAKAFGETRTRNSALRRRASIPVGSRTHGADGGTRTHDVAYRVTNAGPSPLGYIGTIGCEPDRTGGLAHTKGAFSRLNYRSMAPELRFERRAPQRISAKSSTISRSPTSTHFVGAYAPKRTRHALGISEFHYRSAWHVDSPVGNTNLKRWGSWTRTNACYGQNVVPYQTWLLPIIGAGAGARTRTVRLKRPLRCRSRPAGKVGRCGESRTRYYLD